MRLLLKVDDDDECDDAVIEGTCDAESSIDVSFVMGGDVVLVGGRAGGIEARCMCCCSSARGCTCC